MRPLFVVASIAGLSACGGAARAPVALRPQPVPPDAARARLDPAAPAHFAVGLTLQNRDALEPLLRALHDPASPQFRHWLTPQEFGERFGIAAGAYERLASALRSRGFAVGESPNRLFLEATGKVSDVEALWNVRLEQVDSAAGHWRTFSGEPSLPSELARFVQSVHGLDTKPRYFRRLAIGAPYGNVFGPQDLRRYYDATPLHALGFAGQASKVATLGAALPPSDSPDPADVDWFYSDVSDATTLLVIDTLPNANNDFGPPGSGLRQEMELDVEMSTVMAPEEQSARMVLPPYSEVFSTGLNYIVNSLPDVTAVSVSLGACEETVSQDPAAVMTAANMLAQGAAEGQAWFIASGDTGVDTCGNNTASVDFPADVPWATGVGGTQSSQGFDGNNAITSWGNETTWNQGAQGGAGGGGASTLFPRPAYQTGPGTSAANVREVPDIALLAESSPGLALDVTIPNQLVATGGTSLSAPMAAGAFALINDYIGGCRIGSPNPTLYALAAAQQDGGAAVFHDITTGNITFDGVTGPSAQVGYDEATGLGSLDVAALAMAWPPCVDGGSFDAGVFDAGTRVAYDACSLLACDGGATCFTTPEGPSACELACTSSASCPAGQICGTVPGFGQACVPGCTSNASCGDGGACWLCEDICVAAGKATAKVGDPCQSAADCPTAGTCLTLQDGPFTGGYCSVQCAASPAACNCPGSSTCAMGFCLGTCSITANTGCRSGYACWGEFATGDTGVCLPDCASNGDCMDSNFTCNTATGQCLDANQHYDAGAPDAGPPRDAGSVVTPEVPPQLGKEPGCGCAGSADLGSAGTFFALAMALLGRRTRRHSL